MRPASQSSCRDVLSEVMSADPSAAAHSWLKISPIQNATRAFPDNALLPLDEAPARYLPSKICPRSDGTLAHVPELLPPTRPHSCPAGGNPWPNTASEVSAGHLSLHARTHRLGFGFPALSGRHMGEGVKTTSPGAAAGTGFRSSAAAVMQNLVTGAALS